jgi:hypothetical protein
MSFSAVIGLVGTMAERRCLSDRASGVFGAVIAAPVYAAIGLTVAYFAWWPFGAVFTLFSRAIGGYGVLIVFILLVATLGRIIARAMTFPSSVSLIQRQIEREVAQRVSTKLVKTVSALAKSGIANPSNFSPEVFDDFLLSQRVLRSIREKGDLSAHASFVLFYIDVMSACVAILTASAGGSGAASVPPDLLYVGADEAGTSIVTPPVPSVFATPEVLAEFAPSAEDSMRAVAWLARGCTAGTLRCDEVADVMLSAAAVLCHTAVWCESVASTGNVIVKVAACCSSYFYVANEIASPQNLPPILYSGDYRAFAAVATVASLDPAESVEACRLGTHGGIQRMRDAAAAAAAATADTSSSNAEAAYPSVAAARILLGPLSALSDAERSMVRTERVVLCMREWGGAVF